MSPELFIGHKGLQEGAPDLDAIKDIHIHHGKAYIELVTGEIIKTRISSSIKELYWKVKIRNRRHAFGLD